MDVFGPIMAVNLVPHLREALVHYYQKDHAAQAIATMDGFIVGGQFSSTVLHAVFLPRLCGRIFIYILSISAQKGAYIYVYNRFSGCT